MIYLKWGSIVTLSLSKGRGTTDIPASGHEINVGDITHTDEQR